MWRAATLVLVTAFMVLSGWMYLRDKGSYTPLHSERAQVQRAAGRMIELLAPSGTCVDHCGVDVLERTAPHVWRVRLTVRAWQGCFILALGALRFSEQHGVSGIRSVPCHSGRPPGRPVARL